MIAEGLAHVAHARSRLRPVAETGRYPLLDVLLDEHGLGRSAAAVSRALEAGDPPVHLSEHRAVEGILTVHPEGLRDGDEAIVAARLRAVLGGRD